MHYYNGYGGTPRAKATTLEEFMKRGGGGGGPDDKRPEPGALEKKVREWAEGFIADEQAAIRAENAHTLSRYPENMARLKSLGEQFRKVSDPGTEGAVEALKVLWRYRFGLREAQPF